MIDIFILLMGIATLFAAASLWDDDIVRAAASLVAVFLMSGLALLSIGAWFIGAMQVLLGAGAVAILAIYAAVTASQRREVLKAPEASKIAAVTLATLAFSIGFLTISTPGTLFFYSSTAKSVAQTLFSDLGLVAALSLLLLVALISSAYVIRYISIKEVSSNE